MENYIIKTKENKYFAGWDMFGEIKLLEERNLAYRMQRPIAERTFSKVPEADIIEKFK